MGDFSSFPRVRSTVHQQKVVTAQQYLQFRQKAGGTVCGWGSPVNDVLSKVYSNSDTQTTGDVVASNFRSRIARGDVINHAFLTTRIKETMPQEFGQLLHQYGYTDKRITCSSGSKIDLTYELAGPLLPGNRPYLSMEGLSVNRQAVIDQAVTQAYASVDTSAMNALASAAESRKTVDSMAQIMRRAVSVFKSVRKVNLRALRKEITPKEMSNRYMELRYAIRPAIYDAVGLVNALKVERARIRQTYRGYASDSVELTANETSTPCWLMRADWVKTARLQVSARAGVLCDVNVTSFNVFGIDQPVEALWELVPFSFIADWFINIGDTIAAWTPNAGVRQLASWVTVRELRTQTNKVVGASSTAQSGGYNYPYVNFSYGYRPQYVLEELVLERIVNPQLSPWPDMNLRLDGFKLTDLGIIMRNLMR